MATAYDPLDHLTPMADTDALRDLSADCFDRQSMDGLREVIALEVGSWAGGTALVLAEVFDKVFCVDTWKGTPTDRLGGVAKALGQPHVFRVFCRNMGDRLHRTVFPCVGDSLTWAGVWQRPLDLVFIDADHAEAACALDIDVWQRHVRPGGVLCGHDYGAFDGVTKAVDRNVPGRKLLGNSIWYWEVPCL